VRRRQPPPVTELYVGFAELLDTMACRFRREQPTPGACVTMLRGQAVILAAHAEALQEEIDRQRSIALHAAPPLIRIRGG